MESQKHRNCDSPLHAGWGELRRQWLERRIAEFSVVQPDDAMISICAELSQDCKQGGHPLGNRAHNGDRWIAATAIRLGLQLVSDDDGAFVDALRHEVITAAAT